MSRISLLSAGLLGFGTSLLPLGCGNVGAPKPPSLMLPQTVTDLTAARTGAVVSLHWTTTDHTTDDVLLKKPQRARICRAFSKGLCAVVGETTVTPGQPSSYDDKLPADVSTGDPRLLRYEVRLLNKTGRDAGPSAPAFAAGGWAPPQVETASAETTADGVVVRWTVAPETGAAWQPSARLRVAIQRTRVLAAGETGKPTRDEENQGTAQPTMQALEAPEQAGEGSWTPNHTIDADAAMNRTYRYKVQLLLRETLEGHLLSIASEWRESAPVNARDTFAPAVPNGLAAVTDPEDGTIDLSWTADSDSDLIGYVVYRRVEGSSEAAVRVSGAAPLASPAFSDTTAKRGTRYAYAVSAVDANGNESAKSQEAVEGLQP